MSFQVSEVQLNTKDEVLKKVSMVGNDLKLDDGVGTCGKDGQTVPVGVGQPTLKIDEITVGSEDGAPGGVCNVVYFPIAISYERIKVNYNLLQNKNPPVI